MYIFVYKKRERERMDKKETNEWERKKRGNTSEVKTYKVIKYVKNIIFAEKAYKFVTIWWIMIIAK